MTFTTEQTGGEYYHKLSSSEMPVHSHSASMTNKVQLANLGSGSYVVASLNSNGNTNAAYRTGDDGGGNSHNNIQPYITVFFWRRTA